MDREEFAREFGGILLLLRQHSFLAYSAGGRREYEQKIHTAVDQYANLVFRMTGVRVCALHDLIPIESVRQPTFDGGRRLAHRSAAVVRKKAETSSGPERERLAVCATLWKEAAARLAGPAGA